MSRKFVDSEIKDHFKKVPKPVKQKIVKDLVAQDYTQKEIAKMFGVSAIHIHKLANSEINDTLLKKLNSEVEKLNKMKDVYIKAVAKDLELNTYKKLQEGVGEAKYSDVLKTAEFLKSTVGTPSGQSHSQTNIQIVIPDSVKKKFEVTPLENSVPTTETDSVTE
jgi:predicted transcriptional regulator